MSCYLVPYLIGEVIFDTVYGRPPSYLLDRDRVSIEKKNDIWPPA